MPLHQRITALVQAIAADMKAVTGALGLFKVDGAAEGDVLRRDAQGEWWPVTAESLIPPALLEQVNSNTVTAAQAIEDVEDVQAAMVGLTAKLIQTQAIVVRNYSNP